jgi:hypothetical protein
MKKLLFLFLMLKCLSSLNAQSIDSLPWCPPGATWVYTRGFTGANVYYRLQYIGDTLLDNQVTKILEHRYQHYTVLSDSLARHILNQDSLLGYEYLRKHRDTVFRWNMNRQTFDILYIFGGIGTNWIIQPDSLYACPSTSWVYDSVAIYYETNRTIANRIFRRISLSGTLNWYLGDHLLDSIGPTSRPFPAPTNPSNCQEWGWAENLPTPEALSCYADFLRGQLYDWHHCPMLTALQRTASPIPFATDEASLYFVYPNPTRASLHLSKVGTEMPIVEHYEIRNHLSQLILSAQEPFPTSGLSIESLHAGLYFLTFYPLSSQRGITLKFIKND